MSGKIVLFIESLSEKQTLWILVGMTFGLRLYSALMARGISYDGAAYGFMARDFLTHHFAKGLSSALHPLYPFLIYLVSPDPGHVEMAGRFISVFFGTLTVLPIFYLAKEVTGPKGAVLSGLFYSVHPYLVIYSGTILSEATYWGLLSLSVYFFWTALKGRRIFGMVASGGFLALAYLTRPEAIGYLSIFFVWLIFYGGIKKEWFRKMVLMGGVFLPFFIISTPYVIHIHREIGQWVISKKGVGIQSQFLSRVEGRDGPVGERVVEKPKSVVQSSPIPTIMKNFFHYIPSTTYHYLRAYHFALWLFLFFGVIRGRQMQEGGEWFLSSLVLFHLFSLSTFTSSSTRFSVPLIPFSLFWAGAGVLEIQRYLRKVKGSTPIKGISMLVILAILVQLPQSLKPERGHRADEKKVGLWLKENTSKNAAIMSNSPIEAFYAEREFVLLPSGLPAFGIPGKSYRDIILFARQKGVDYILINRNTHEFNPDFEESIRPADLREFYKNREKDGTWIIVYEVIH